MPSGATAQQLKDHRANERTHEQSDGSAQEQPGHQAECRSEHSQPRAAGRFIVTRVLPAGVRTNLAIFIGIGVFLGYLGFMGVPRFIDSVFPYDKRVFGPSLFLFMFYIFINIHHYFLDNVMWRRGNPDVQRHIFAAPNTAAR